MTLPEEKIHTPENACSSIVFDRNSRYDECRKEFGEDYGQGPTLHEAGLGIG